ncbi:MAG: 16S rRNA (cytidine(1402)-2'-O)-methyltransferase [Clostridia bacterium]|nr:16S rRNA (cytidine(1402)-2'-O)-methyltransferase [Clostridia bacterium]
MTGSGEKNKTEKGVLYLVATPIGNLADISERAIKVLSEVDFVAAEDTRNSGKLLSVIGVKKPMISYFEHNKAERGDEIVSRIKNGESCALVTDAGMPAISDPGEDIVRLCHERGVTVRIVPGACAAVSALAVSGLPTGKFVFEGFLPAQKNERRRELESLKTERRTIIFYEAPHKLRSTLSDMSDILGNRKISLCRELTKINEEVNVSSLREATAHYETTEPRGEYVLVVGGATDDEIKNSSFFADMTVSEHVEHYVASGMTKNDAMKACAKDRGVSKSEIYAQIMKK